MALEKRIKRIQRAIGVEADGHIGPATISRLEQVLEVAPVASHAKLEISKKSIDALVKFEVSSEAYYRQFLQAPMYPGAHSGPTVGIGYDLGTQSASRIRKDFRGLVSDDMLEKLASASGVQGEKSKAFSRKLENKGVRIPLDVAKKVFLEASLPRYAEKTRKAYPGIHNLPADAQGAMLSLVYNRGTRKSGASRREMKNLGAHIRSGDLEGMADEFRAMKRLWDKDRLPGLHTRRDAEARLVENADRDYGEAELIRV